MVFREFIVINRKILPTALIFKVYSKKHGELVGKEETQNPVSVFHCHLDIVAYFISARMSVCIKIRYLL